MSLINKMLIDLDARSEEASEVETSRPIFEDLRPANDPVLQEGLRHRKSLALFVFVSVLAATTASLISLPGVSLSKGSVLAMIGLTNSSDAMAMDTEIEPPPPLVLDTPEIVEKPAVAKPSETEKAEPVPIEPVPVVPELSSPGVTKVTEDELGEEASTSAVTNQEYIKEVAKSVTDHDGEQPQAPPAPPILPSRSESEPLSAPGSDTEMAPVEMPVQTMSPVRTAPDKAIPGNEIPEQSLPEAEMGRVEPVSESGMQPQKILRPLNDEQLADNNYRSALEYFRKGHMDKAEKELDFALKQFPRHLQAREMLVDIQLQQGHWVEAQQQLFKGLAMSPEHYPFAQRLARLFVEQGNETRALALLEQSRQYANTDADYLGFIAVLYQRAERHTEASEAFTQALGMKPDQGKWWLGLAISLEAEKKWLAARNAYLRVHASENVEAHLLDFSRQRLEAIQRHLKQP